MGMPDNPRPSAESEPQASPGEFDFAQPKPENPRIKRRSLKAAPAPATAATPAPVASEPTPDPDPAAPKESPAAAPATETPRSHEPAPPAKTFTPYTTRQPNPPPSQSSPLYYSSGARKEKEDAAPSPTPMKTSPSGATPSSSNVPASSTPFRSTATPASSPARGTSVVDYRANIERQTREQKSIGGVLSIVVYVLIGFFVISAALAGYGAYVLSKQIHQQSITVSDLDKRYAAENAALNANLKTTGDSLIEAQAQIERQQEMIVHQQETINQLIATTNKLIVTTNQLTANTAALASSIRQERQTRAAETASLRARVHALEPRADQ
jgi:hypothetical protein